MRLFQKQHHGFTLIELIITVAIMALVVGGSIAGFVGFTERQEVLNTAKEVQQLMRVAQSKARVRDVPMDMAGPIKCNTLMMYRVYFNGSSSFNLRPGCNDPLVNFPVMDSLTVQIPSGVSVTTSPALTWLNFNTLGQDTSWSGTITFTKGSNIFRFTVNSSGTVSNIVDDAGRNQ